MSAGALVCIALALLTILVALNQPWLGLRLVVETDAVQVAAARGPAASIDAGSTLVALAQDGRMVAVDALDLTPEPDVLKTFDLMRAFRGDQHRMAAMLRNGEVGVDVVDSAGQSRSVKVAPAPRRPLGDLPPVFWVQILVGSIAFIIGAWVWALKPADWAARLFALSGLSMLLATNSAAIYSTRELALDGGLFRALSIINGAGAAGFGVAMICMFLIYPRALVKRRWFFAPFLVATAWWSVWALEIASVPTLSQYLMMTEMLAILVILGVQVWATRNDPTGRAVLLWLGLSVAIGAGAFVFSNAGPVLLGFSPAISQGYAFVFFLVIYVGLALGLRRYRLFEMGEWAFRILFYIGAALAFLAIDAVLIWALQLAPASALGIALLLVAFLYMPLRDGLWRKTVARRRVQEHELFEAVIETAFAATATERADRWNRLVTRLFDPLETRAVMSAPNEPVAASDGLELTLPAMADGPGLSLRYPWQGRGLFGPVHLHLASQLTRLMRHAEASRDAFERGAAGERGRIARDLHDDVGARLLSGLHKPDVEQTRDVLREAMADMRTIVGGLTGAGMPLSTVVAELRHECGRRLDAAGITLDWPVSEADADDTLLPYRVYKNWSSAQREIVSNVIRHSGADRLVVEIARRDDTIVLAIIDNGRGLAQANEARSGAGLGNVARRVAEIGGTVDYPASSQGLAISLVIPMTPTETSAVEPRGAHV